MVKDRILGLLKGATEVNLRYTAIALNLAKQYVKEFDGVVRRGAPGAEESEPPSSGGGVKRRPPIFLVGTAGTEAGGAFVLNNSADSELAVRLVVQGDLGPAEARVEPESFAIPAGDSAVVQLRVPIDEAMEVGRDYAGAVIAPSLAAEPVEFVVRRLAGQSAPAPAGKRKASPGRAPG